MKHTVTTASRIPGKGASLALTLLALSALAGCGWLPDNSLLYRDAAVTDPIQVPEGGVFTAAATYSVPVRKIA